MSNQHTHTTYHRTLNSCAAFLAFSMLVGCGAPTVSPPDPASKPELGLAPEPVTARFKDHDGKLPPNYDGPFFKLSQDYPSAEPKPGPQPWLDIDPRKDPDKYQLAIRDYFFAGMREADFRGQDNKVRKWYHVPWMHVGDNPRESVRGLTFERRSRPGELGEDQTDTQQNWGSGFYNPLGGYVVGQVWRDENNPNPKMSQFLEGTVVVKLLFSAAPLTQVPDLKGAPTWKAYIRENHYGKPDEGRQLADVRLVQMDIAVKDKRAGTTGWFFGSLVYEAASPAADAWDKLTPSGLQWGNDPKLDLLAWCAGDRVQESVLSKKLPKLASYKQELGWLGRLNGPVDNHVSSCMSCHSTSQWRVEKDMIPPEDTLTPLRWFRNLRGDEAFSNGQIALDYSLQIALSLQNFCKFNPRVEVCRGAKKMMSVTSESDGPGEDFMGALAPVCPPATD